MHNLNNLRSSIFFDWSSIFLSNKCIKLVSECAKIIPEVKYVGWDVAITENGASLIEGNCYPGIYQIKPSFINKKCGLVKTYEDAMKIRIDKI